MNLYDIDARLATILEFDGEMVDTSTGEIVPVEDIEALQMAREEKVEGWGLWIKNKTAEIAAIKEEENKLKARRETLENRVERSAERYQNYLAGEKVNTPRLVVKYTKSESAVYNGEIEALPEIYKRTKTSVEVDKVELKKALKSGLQIEGAELVTKENIKIS